MGGFTIIEVTIFLTISGLLLTMAIIGSNGMARQLRFSDSVNGFHSYIQRQYESIVSGVNTRDVVAGACSNVAPGTSDCILLGKVMSFDPAATSTTVTTRYVIGGSVASSGTTYTDIANVAAPMMGTKQLQPVDNGSDSFEIAWGADIYSASRDGAPALLGEVLKAPAPAIARTEINNVAFLRSPNSSEIMPYYFKSASTGIADIKSGLVAAVATANYQKTSQTTARLCIANSEDYTLASSPKAAILFGNGRGVASIDTNYQPSVGAAGIC